MAMIAAPVVLTLVAAVTSWLPTRRAARVGPGADVADGVALGTFRSVDADKTWTIATRIAMGQPRNCPGSTPVRRITS